MVEVILPVLDEAEAIPWLLARMPNGYSPIVVDNGSVDGSGDVARELGARVIDEPRAGYGAACAAGLESAASEVVCLMDCDGTIDPAELPKIAAPVIAGKADLVVGERIPERGSWSRANRLANAVITWELRRRGDAELRDLGPVRAARREGLLALEIVDRRSGYSPETVARALAAGWRVRGVPVGYRPRVGSSKVTGSAAGALAALRDTFRALRSS